MNRLQKILTIASICCIANVGIAQSASYDGKDVNNRLKRIEKDLRLLNKEVYNNGVSPLSGDAKSGVMSKSQIADFEIRLSSLEESIRKTKGEVENITYSHEQLAKKVEKLQLDIDFRLNNMETTKQEPKLDLSAFQKQDSSAKKTKSTPLTVVKGTETGITPEQQYKEAFTLLKIKEFDKAEKSFTAFIANYPNHKLAGNAQYWLAETFYVRGDMEEAMRQFAYGYKNYKESSKATDNLLKLGITLGAIDRKEDACLTLAELKDNYSPLSKTILNRMTNEQKKLNCSE